MQQTRAEKLRCKKDERCWRVDAAHAPRGQTSAELKGKKDDDYDEPGISFALNVASLNLVLWSTKHFTVYVFFTSKTASVTVVASFKKNNVF